MSWSISSTKYPSHRGMIRQIFQKSRGELSINIRDLLDRRERLASRHRNLELELNRLPVGDDVDKTYSDKFPTLTKR